MQYNNFINGAILSNSEQHFTYFQMTLHILLVNPCIKDFCTFMFDTFRCDHKQTIPLFISYLQTEIIMYLYMPLVDVSQTGLPQAPAVHDLGGEEAPTPGCSPCFPSSGATGGGHLILTFECLCPRKACAL